MKKQKEISPKIVIIGSGNVGTQLSKRLHARGLDVVQVFSRKAEKAKHLAKAIDSKWTNSLAKVVPTADLYILAVHDDWIGNVAGHLAKAIEKDSLVVHTSGSTPSTVIAPHFERYGVFYPLQTFNIKKKPQWSKIPICLYTSRDSDLTFVKKIAKRISQKVFELNDEQRATAHVTAVMVNNFTNYLFASANDILEKENLPFELLRPLILETAQKVQNASPKDMQTGPAARGDEATIERHLQFLEKYPDLKPVYELLTKRILNERRKK